MKDYTGAKPEQVLKEVFGYDSFRLLQKDIISNVLQKKDTLAIMPTGGGKSLCYQIPALIFEGLTVVVSPLISLMQDQVDSLVQAGVNAVFLNSTVEWENYLEAMNSIRRGETKIVYVSPEGLNSAKIRDLLHDTRVKVSCITIDEAHCVSEWGHDFRPEFLEIASVRRQFPEAVCLALTATATLQVRQDIITNLALRDPAVLISSFNRPNIFLDVRPKTDAVSQVVECIRRHWDESGIIYCFSRKQVDTLTQTLLDLGYSALNYHAGLSDEERKNHQNQFIRDQVQIMVATLAFGMGIDKPNVRFVIHYDLPKSLEQYYQEIGRAGRDGLPAEALLLYSGGDIFKLRHFFTDAADPEKSEKLLQGMVNYATSRQCRRKTLLAYFGEKYEGAPGAVSGGDTASSGENPSGAAVSSRTGSIQSQASTDVADCCCDVCSTGPALLVDMTVPAQKFMSCIIRTNSRFGTGYITDVLLGSRNKRILENGHNMISTWGIGTELDKSQWFFLAGLLLEKNYIVKTGDYGVLNLTREGLGVLKNRDRIMLPFDLSRGSDGASGESGSGESLAAGGVFVPKNRAGTGSTGGLMFPKPEKKSRKDRFRLLKKSAAGGAGVDGGSGASGAGFPKQTAALDPSDQQGVLIAAALKKWRRKTAEEMNVPPYVIFGDRTMNDIAIKKPRTMAELMECNGIGENKARKFGEDILSVVSGV